MAATVFHSDIKNPVVNSDGELLLKLLPIREEDDPDINGTPAQVLNAVYGTIHIWMEGERVLCGWHCGPKALPKKLTRFHESLSDLRPCNTGRGEHRAFCTKYNSTGYLKAPPTDDRPQSTDDILMNEC